MRERALLAGAALFLSASESRADSLPLPHVPIGFSKLLVRLDGRDEVGIAGADYAVSLIEEIRARGYQAVGAENLVFGKDESARAEYVVEGTVREVACLQRALSISCRIGVEWQVLDVARDEVVYSVMSRAAILDTPPDEKDKIAGRLLLRAMDMLLARDNFRSILLPHAIASRASDPAFPSATLARCTPGRSVAEKADDLLGKVVVVKGRTGFGSGFLVSKEGLVLTAAHVLKEPRVAIRLREGAELEYVPVRIAAHADVALLRPVEASSNRPCVAMRLEPPPSGAEVYAVGAPESLQSGLLAHAGTRERLSADRRPITLADGHARESGNCTADTLVDGSGAVVGVVASKYLGARVEGLAFAVPVADALAALGLRLGDASDPGLLSETAKFDEAPKVALYKDLPDTVPWLDAGAPRRSRPESFAPARYERTPTPGFVPVMRWGGLAVGFVGIGVGAFSYLAYNAQTTAAPQFRTLEAVNTTGWIFGGVGAGLFAPVFCPGCGGDGHAILTRSGQASRVAGMFVNTSRLMDVRRSVTAPRSLMASPGPHPR